MKSVDELKKKGPNVKPENYNDIKKELEDDIKYVGPISKDCKGPEKNIDTLIDYITKCDIEIPKVILALSNLLPDDNIRKSINELLKGDDNE